MCAERAERNEPLEERLAVLEQRLAAAALAATRAQDRGDVENVFSRYMHYHNAFEDERIIDELWVRRGTEGVRSQYNDDGVYTDWDTIMEYHRGRPHPVGKLMPYQIDTAQQLVPEPPQPYAQYEDTFR